MKHLYFFAFLLSLHISAFGQLRLNINQIPFVDDVFVSDIKYGTSSLTEINYLDGNCTMLNQDGVVAKRCFYYPYTMQKAYNELINSPSESNLKYSGKELDVMYGLNQYTLQAEYLDSSWDVCTNVGSISKKYFSIGLYACFNNNLRRFSVPTEMFWVENEKTGNVEWRKAYTKDNLPKGYTYIGEEYMGLSIKEYKENVDEFGNPCDGTVTLKVFYIDRCKPNNKKNDVRWIQTVITNKPAAGAESPYLDNLMADENKPFFYEDFTSYYYKNRNGHDHYFSDAPTRSGYPDGTKWQGELSLVRKGQQGYYPVVTITWGYELKGGKAVSTTIIVTKPSVFTQDKINYYNRNGTLGSPQIID